MKTNLTSRRTNKIKFAVLLTFFLAAAAAASAQYKAVVTNDPSGDAGMMGIDVKNVSYMMSTDKKDITIKIETYNAVSSWNDAGFGFYIDEDLNPNNGMATDCANQSMKADRSIMCMNMMGSWMSSLTLSSAPSSPQDISSFVSISMPDSKTALVKMPLNKVDGNNDGKFNLLIGSIVAGASAFYIDDLPNTGYSSLDVLKASSVQQLSSGDNNIAVYPNPAVNTVSFRVNGATDGTVAVYDLTGKQVALQSVSGSLTTLGVSNLASGTYLYHIADSDGQTVQNGTIAVAH